MPDGFRRPIHGLAARRLGPLVGYAQTLVDASCAGQCPRALETLPSAAAYFEALAGDAGRSHSTGNRAGGVYAGAR